jgi:hypothetical protein
MLERTSTDRPPTAKQLATLKRIAYASQRSFAMPGSSAEASAEITRMMTFRRRRRTRSRT